MGAYLGYILRVPTTGKAAIGSRMPWLSKPELHVRGWKERGGRKKVGDLPYSFTAQG